MMPHDFMTLHAAKAIEYGIAIAYLLLFIPFWRFVTVRPVGSHAYAHAAAGVVPSLKRLFTVPERLFYHPGHAWLRVDDGDMVTVGFDDFAGKLVGTPTGIALPAVGSTVCQGEPAWALEAEGRSVPMLSPVDGTVVAVNDRAQRSPEEAHRNPYETGWMLKVRSPRLSTNLKQLLSGQMAVQWMEGLATELQGNLQPALGTVYQDGGVVVDGLAKVLGPDGWDAIARRYLLTDDQIGGTDGGTHA